MSNKTTSKKKDIQYYMKLPYAMRIIPEEAGWYFAEIEEFPGCMAKGETPEEVFKSMEISKEMWLNDMISRDMPIPEPEITKEYSGRILVRIPPSLHKRIANAAKMENLSLNQMILFLLTDKTSIYEIKEEIINAIQKSITGKMANFIDESKYDGKVIPFEKVYKSFQEESFQGKFDQNCKKQESYYATGE